MNSNDIPTINDTEVSSSTAQANEARRDFLRKSLYAAYATPVIMSMFVEKANAATSWGSKPGSPVIPPPPRR